MTGHNKTFWRLFCLLSTCVLAAVAAVNGFSLFTIMDLHKPPQDKENTYNMIIHKFKFFNLPFFQASTTRHHRYSSRFP